MSYLDTALNALKNAQEKASGVIQDATSEWNRAMSEAKSKASEFLSVFTKLKSKSETAKKIPGLESDFNSLIEKGEIIKTTIEKVLGNGSLPVSNHMGFALPLIPIALVLSAIAAISAWLAPAYVMLRKLEVAEKLISKGENPDKVLRVIESGESNIIKDTGNTVSNITKLVGLTIGGFILYRSWPKIKGFF